MKPVKYTDGSLSREVDEFTPLDVEDVREPTYHSGDMKLSTAIKILAPFYVIAAIVGVILFLLT